MYTEREGGRERERKKERGSVCVRERERREKNRHRESRHRESKRVRAR